MDHRGPGEGSRKRVRQGVTTYDGRGAGTPVSSAVKETLLGREGCVKRHTAEVSTGLVGQRRVRTLVGPQPWTE